MPPKEPELFGISISKLARICRVSKKTAARWKDGTTCPPETALMILRADLECFDPAWVGWVCRNGKLVSPEGWEMSISDVLASRLHEAQLGVYRAENRRLKAELEDALCPIKEDQPTTEDWDIQILAG